MGVRKGGLGALGRKLAAWCLPHGQTTGEYDILLKLKQKRSHSQIESGEAREYDHYELSLRIRPENSFPEVP